MSQFIDFNARRALSNVLKKRVNQRLRMQAGRGRTTYGQQPLLRRKHRVDEGFWPKLSIRNDNTSPLFLNNAYCEWTSEGYTDFLLHNSIVSRF